MGLMSAAKYIKKTAGKALSNGKMEKACIVIYKKSGSAYVIDKINSKDKKVQVQFNPSEYSIQRSTRMSRKSRLGADFFPSDFQTVGGEPSTLSLNLYFDSYTELQAGQGFVNSAANKITDFAGGQYGKMQANSKYLPHFDMNEEHSPDPDLKVNELCDTLLSLVKFDHEEHEPRLIGFIWGEHLHFIGKLHTYTVQYTVFDRNGTPVRAKIAMQIMGEEAGFLRNGAQFPKESPDRTKQRILSYGDQMWMMAQDEYGDVNHWKTIAAANGILNPRTVDGVVRLKVPSIR